MPRYEIKGDPISVAYGYDFPVPGVFLAVTDKRLEYDPGASKGVNAVTESIGVGDGGGSYFDLHTGMCGFGIKVDDKTMATFLKRYGVTDQQIRMLPLNLEGGTAVGGDAYHCGVCNKEASKQCTICKKVGYCSKECQRKGWAVHKLFCELKPVDPKTTGRTIEALFLSENEETPQIVRLPVVWEEDEEGGSLMVDASDYIDGMTGRWRSDSFPKQDPSWPSAYIILYKDDALIDGHSEENACMKQVIEKVAKSVWGNQRSLPKGSKSLNRGPPVHFRGNLLVLKAEKRTSPFMSSQPDTYLDVKLKDTHRIAKLLYEVNLAYVSES